MTNRPSVSVLMPVYNAERYAAQAVESILNQSLNDFEFLIVDDGSTDGSRAILERYAAQDECIPTLLKILSQITEPSRGVIRMRGRVGSLLESAPASVPVRRDLGMAGGTYDSGSAKQSQGRDPGAVSC